MPARLALLSVATPRHPWKAVPTAAPLIVNEIVFPGTGDAADTSVADRLTVPPNVPVAGPRRAKSATLAGVR